MVSPPIMSFLLIPFGRNKSSLGSTAKPHFIKTFRKPTRILNQSSGSMPSALTYDQLQELADDPHTTIDELICYVSKFDNQKAKFQQNLRALKQATTSPQKDISAVLGGAEKSSQGMPGDEPILQDYTFELNGKPYPFKGEPYSFPLHCSRK